MLRKNFSGMFMVLSILLMSLHTMRGWKPVFIVEGSFPYIMYYGTIGLYVVCLLWYGYDLAKTLYHKTVRKKPK